MAVTYFSAKGYFFTQKLILFRLNLYYYLIFFHFVLLLCHSKDKEVHNMPSTGEKPGKGRYQCIHCGQIVILDDTTDTLPPCPSCHKTTYVKR